MYFSFVLAQWLLLNRSLLKVTGFYGVKLASVLTIIIISFPIYQQEVFVRMYALIHGNVENSETFTPVCVSKGRKDQIAKTLVGVLPH